MKGVVLLRGIRIIVLPNLVGLVRCKRSLIWHLSLFLLGCRAGRVTTTDKNAALSVSPFSDLRGTRGGFYMLKSGLPGRGRFGLLLITYAVFSARLMNFEGHLDWVVRLLG